GRGGACARGAYRPARYPPSEPAETRSSGGHRDTGGSNVPTRLPAAVSQPARQRPVAGRTTGRLFDWFVSGGKVFVLIERLPCSACSTLFRSNTPTGPTK